MSSPLLRTTSIRAENALASDACMVVLEEYFVIYTITLATVYVDQDYNGSRS